MGVKSILREHASVGKCFENDLCKLWLCNLSRLSVNRENEQYPTVAFFLMHLCLLKCRALHNQARGNIKHQGASPSKAGMWCHAVTSCDLS